MENGAKNAGSIRKHRAWLTFFCLIFFGSQSLFSADSPVSKEYQIKAAFLYNFTKFVEWPPQRFETTASPIRIGVLGTNPFGDELELIVRGRKINGRELKIKILESTNEATTVDLLFVTAGEEKRITDDMAKIQSAGVLTVGESKQFGELGGIIIFTKVAGKIRFEINQDSAEQAGLKISAQLLKLADGVHKKS